MFSIKIFISLLFLLTSSLISSKETINIDYIVSEITITDSLITEEIQHKENLHLFLSTFDKSLGKFIMLQIFPKDLDDYNHIFVSIPGNDTEIPSYRNSDYKTVDKNTSLLIEIKNIQQDMNSGKILIECKDSCDFKFSYQIVKTIPLVDDRSFDLILNSNEGFILEYEIPENPETSLNNKFTFFSNSPTDFDLQIEYQEKSITPLSEFYNGYGIFLRGGSEQPYQTGETITFTLSHYGKPQELVHVSNRKLQNDIVRVLSVGDFHSSITGIDEISQECFNLPKIKEEETDKNYNINFLSFTKNILVTFSNNEENENEEKTILINTESDVIQINAKEYSQMCLSSNDNKVATTTFQLLDGTEQTINQDQQMPLYRGVPRKSKLLKGQIAYYKLNFYPTYSSHLIMNLRSISGNAKLYYGICSTYPNCDFNEEKLNLLETEKDINKNTFFIKEIDESKSQPYSDPEFQAAVVYCPYDENENEGNGECEYFITLSNDRDKINIIENEKYYSSIKALDSDNYQFDIYDSQNELNYLYLELYSYIGGSNIYIYSDSEMTQEITVGNYTTFANKEYLLISANDMPNRTLNGKYYFKIKCNSNSVYSVFYKTIKIDEHTQPLEEIVVDNNEISLEGITINDKVRSFMIENRNKEKGNPFLLEFNSLNCELSVSLTGESGTIEGRRYQFFIDSSKSYYQNDFYELRIQIKNLDIDNTYKNNLCLFTILGNEIISDNQKENNEIVIIDGYTQKGTLSLIDNEKNNKINYVYSFKPEKIDNDNLSLFINKKSKGVINFSYSFGNSDNYIDYKIINNERKFYFLNSDFNEQCKNHSDSYCVLKLKFFLPEGTEKNIKIDYDFTISNEKPYPIYLNKGEIMKNILQTNQYQYYYLDIGKEQSCDIYIDFTEGTGQSVLKIVQKDQIEESFDYNRRVVLPKYGMSDTLVYDQMSKMFKITGDMTKKCENGCEIYIGVFHSDQKFKEKTNSYQIYYRMNNNNDIIYLDENLIGKGNLKSLDDKNIFRTKITKTTDRVIFYLFSKNATSFINNNENVPSKSNYQYILSSNENDKEGNGPSLEIKIDPDTDDDIIFTYIVVTNELDGLYRRSFEIKIEVPEKNIPNIKQMDFVHNSRCYFNNDIYKCYYILPIYRFNIEDKIYIFTPDNNETSIYATNITIEEYDSLSPEQKIEKFPTKPYNTTTNHLIIDLSNRKQSTDVKLQEINILLVVENENYEINERKATLVVGEFYLPSSNYLRPECYNFYSLDKESNKNINLVLEAENVYKVSFYLLNKGKGIIQQSQLSSKDFLLDENNNKFLIFSVDPELRAPKTFSVKIDESSDDDLYFYISVETSSNIANMVEITETDIQEQKIDFLKNEENIYTFPLIFYQKINSNKQVINDEQFIFEFIERLPKDSSLSEAKISVKASIVNEKFIYERKGSDDVIFPDKSIIINEIFDSKSLASGVRFLKEDIEKQITLGNNYFYIEMIESSNNKVQLEYFEIDLVKTSFLYSNINLYREYPLNKEQNKFLLLVPEMGVYLMALDFMTSLENLNNYNITVNQYYSDNDDYSKNSTYLIKEANFVNGKKKFILYISQNIHYIVLNLVTLSPKKSNSFFDGWSDTLLLKYRVETSDPVYFSLSSRDIERNLDKKKLEISFKGVLESSSSDPHDDYKVKYVLNFYDRETLGNGNITSINSIYVKESPLLSYNKTFSGSNTKNKELNWTVEINENNKKEQIVHLLAYASYKDNEEILAYHSFIIAYDENENITDRTFEFWLILFGFFGIIIITFGVVFVYLYARNDVPRVPPSIPNNYDAISRIRPSSRRMGESTRMTN